MSNDSHSAGEGDEAPAPDYQPDPRLVPRLADIQEAIADAMDRLEQGHPDYAETLEDWNRAAAFLLRHARSMSLLDLRNPLIFPMGA